MRFVPELLAAAHGLTCVGPHVCFYCGAPTGEAFPAAAHVKMSFTGRNDVARPASAWVCQGCVLCLREDCTVTYPDGSVRRQTKGAMRGHSWVITARQAVAATKAHLAYLRDCCLGTSRVVAGDALAIVLADSGQKHLLYRGVVCWPGAERHLAVTLEGERVDYDVARLAERLTLAGRLAAAAGKPALAAPPAAYLAVAASDYYTDWETLLRHWEAVYGQALTRLAAWLCPGRDDARRLYPATGAHRLSGIPPPERRARGQRTSDGTD